MKGASGIRGSSIHPLGENGAPLFVDNPDIADLLGKCQAMSSQDVHGKERHEPATAARSAASKAVSETDHDAT